MSGIDGITGGPSGPQTGSRRLPGLAEVRWGARAEARVEAVPERSDGQPPTFVVFKTETCPFCTQTMQFLGALHKERGDFQVAVVDATAQREEFQRASAYTRRTTVPQIFLDGRFVGGWDDLARAAKRGQLDAYLDGEEWVLPKTEGAARAPWWAFWRRRSESPAT